jgi:methylmalonyl-CoA/ethylmalonyl-CoA epimerase
MAVESHPFMIFDHAGIVVRDIERSPRSMTRLLPISGRTKRFDDPLLGVSVQFLKNKGGIVFELIAPFGPNSPVAKIASGHRDIINQLAYRVENLAVAGSHFRSCGAVPTGAPKAAVAFDGALVQFFYTREGFIVELIEAPAFNHHFEPLT